MPEYPPHELDYEFNFDEPSLEQLWDKADMDRKRLKEEGENPSYGPGNPDWERDFDKTTDNPDDPKHEMFADLAADKADMDRKREKEDGPMHDEWCWVACPHGTSPDDPALD